MTQNPHEKVATRIKLDVYVDLDPIRGPFSTPESAQVIVEEILKARIPHYRPIAVYPTKTDPFPVDPVTPLTYCQNLTTKCSNVAMWKVVTKHRMGGVLCSSVDYCRECWTVIAQQALAPGGDACTTHGFPAQVEWKAL